MNAILRALNTALKPILRELTVESALDVGPSFRHIVLRGEALQERSCKPGDKVQVFIDGEFRTYSPFDFDARTGRMSLLTYLHGGGPGDRWARAVRSGNAVHVFGPRGSIDFAAQAGPLLIVGDETSMAAARSAQRDAGRAVEAVFEVGSEEEARRAADAIGLRDYTLVAREPGAQHRAAIEERVRSVLQPSTTLVLTGCATSIQALRGVLRERPTPHASQKNKAYWAPGKRGLD